MKIETREDCNTGEHMVIARFDLKWAEKALFDKIVEQVAHEIASVIVAKRLPEIMEAISPEAIANMTIAAAGAKVNETLNKKMPDKILEIERTKTEVYQRGVFGGMTRIK